MNDGLLNAYYEHLGNPQGTTDRRRKRIIQRWIDAAQQTLHNYDVTFHCTECGEVTAVTEGSDGLPDSAFICPSCKSKVRLTSHDVLNGMINVDDLSDNAT